MIHFLMILFLVSPDGYAPVMVEPAATATECDAMLSEGVATLNKMAPPSTRYIGVCAPVRSMGTAI